MKITQRLKKTAKPFVDVKAWINFNEIKQSGSSIVNLFKGIFQGAQSDQTETFEEAVQRMGLTEDSLIRQEKSFIYLMLFFILLAVCLLIYSFYLLSLGSYHGALATFAIMFIALSLAFRYHFWHFQLKKRKLGCTFKEWFDSTFRGKN